MPSSTRHPYDPPPWAAGLTAPPTHRLRLASLPTPIEPFSVPGMSANHTLRVKRDDATGISLSGNKVRKLEFLLADAVAQACDVVLTCGGLQSNHARATAVAARQLGMDSLLVLRTAATDTNPGLEGNLLLDRLVGADLHLVTPEGYAERDALMSRLASELRAAGRTPYIIPEGGSNALGCWGYIEALRELEKQLQTDPAPPTDLVFACGSGGTAAGLAYATHLAGLDLGIHAVNVCNDAAYFHRRVSALGAELGVDRPSAEVLDIMDGHVGEGYAISTGAELRFLIGVARATGILLDPVYSGKALYGLRQELAQRPGRFRGTRILFLHTGGLFGLYDKLPQLAPLLGLG